MPSAKVNKDVFNGIHKEEVARAGELEHFIWSLDDEPHKSRRAAIIKAHPEVRELMGVEPLTKYATTALVLLQFFAAYQFRNSPWTWQFWLTAYVVGATATQAIFLAIHEISHYLAFKTFWHNKVFSLFCNLPLCVPYAASFRGYHIEHHKHQGVDGVDVDLPTKLECKLFNSTLGKLFFIANMIPFYALRPVFVRQQLFTAWHALNIALILMSNALIVHFWGWGSIFYLLASDYLAGSLHPSAGHFIAEHYVFLGKHETYSYYGWFNWFIFNVGYHNEHHDFPNIPWTRLPKLREIAPEFYDTIPHHTSYITVMWKFVTDPRVGMYSRVKREDKEKIGLNPCGAATGKQD